MSQNRIVYLYMKPLLCVQFIRNTISIDRYVSYTIYQHTRDSCLNNVAVVVMGTIHLVLAALGPDPVHAASLVLVDQHPRKSCYEILKQWKVIQNS